MQQWGTTAAGTSRWRCRFCTRSAVRKRPDILYASRLSLFTSWLTGTRSLTDIAHTYRISRQTLSMWFTPYWNHIPSPVIPPAVDILIIDGLYLETRSSCVLIGRTKTLMASWIFAERECYGSWVLFCRKLPAPRVVVCDGQRGMRSALRDTWPQVSIQRCMFHVYQLVLIRLTRRPKTEAGMTLLCITKDVFCIHTRRQKRRWIRRYRHWKKHHASFLKERTEGTLPGKKRSWWYTHKRIRSVRTLIDHAIPELFTFIGHADIPRSTNHVEGGINSRLAELLHRHRGLSIKKKQVLVATFLSEKQRGKPTRNFT